MSLTNSQREQLIQLKQAGFTKEQAFARVFRESAIEPTNPQGRFSDVGEDIVTTAREFGQGFNQRVKDIRSVVDEPAITAQETVNTGGSKPRAFMAGLARLPEAAVTAGANVVGGAFDAISSPFLAAGRAALSQEEEDKISGAFNKAVDATGLPEKVAELDERGQRRVRTLLSAPDAIGLGLFGRGSSVVSRTLSATNREAARSIDDVVNSAVTTLKEQAKDPSLTPRAREEAARASLSFQERYIGLEPDVKARLEKMGVEKLQEYLDATHIRNIDDTAPTPYEVGSRNVRSVADDLDELLKSTGSDIGQTRQKLSTVRLNQPQIEVIENTFNRHLAQLNLKVVNGEIVPKRGTITPAAKGDINALNALYSDLQTFKQSPTLANAIDLRKNFDARVKFGKSARDVSNEVDPLSRAVRSSIADEAAKVVGKTGAADLEKYSNFMDAYGDLRSFTDRAAGGEYLLRLVLSGRGGEARQLIETIKEYTGRDLLDDATAMKVATETLGNTNTQNLFRQEIEKAGYDVGAVLTGSPTGILAVVGSRLLDYGIDPEKVLQKAASGGFATPEALGKAAAAGTLGVVALQVAEEDPELGLGMLVVGMAQATPAPIAQLDNFITQQTKRLETMRADGRSVNNAQYKKIEKTIADANNERNNLLKTSAE